MFVLTSTMTSDCTTYGTIDDRTIEIMEEYILTLVEGNLYEIVGNDAFTITILDNDSKTCINV